MRIRKYFTVMLVILLPIISRAQEIITPLPDSLTQKQKDALLKVEDSLALRVADSLKQVNDSLIQLHSNNTLNPLVDADTAKVVTDITVADTTAKIKEPKPPYLHQFRIGFDMAKVVNNFLSDNNTAYEIQADYRLRKDVYIAAEGGWGRGKVDKTELSYTTNSTYLRLGLEKSMLDRINKRDLDLAFFGFRYGLGIGNRSDAAFLVPSPFGVPTEGSSPGQNFVIHWGEMVAGIKTELWNGIYAGWSFRAKFLLNPGVFPELAPNFIAGYGRADRATSFDFNFYLSYAIRWGKDDYDALKKK